MQIRRCAAAPLFRASTGGSAGMGLLGTKPGEEEGLLGVTDDPAIRIHRLQEKVGQEAEKKELLGEEQREQESSEFKSW